MADYITTYSKVHINPMQPDIDKIKLVDIAHALSLLCRANGHFKHFYSVAQHSINCALEAKARGLSQRIQLACLLHDGSEAYLSDITRPVKKHLEKYQEIEAVMQCLVYQAFGLSDVTNEECAIVNEIDDAMLYHEFLVLMGEQIFESVPKILSKPNFEFTDFNIVERDFIRLATPSDINIIDGACVGIDGCKGGWICAIIENEQLNIIKINAIDEIKYRVQSSNPILIDMPVGLQSSNNHIRPDTYARQIIKERSSTIFPAPCRQAVYADSVSDAYSENERVLGKKFTPLTVGIIPKIREVDAFLQDNIEYKNRIIESHPEVCFAILNGKTVLTKKNEIDGINERTQVLKQFIPFLSVDELTRYSKNFKCNLDDIIDAICLAVTCTYIMTGRFKSIPPNPMMDETGLLMQMVIPKI